MKNKKKTFLHHDKNLLLFLQKQNIKKKTYIIWPQYMSSQAYILFDVLQVTQQIISLIQKYKVYVLYVPFFQ